MPYINKEFRDSLRPGAEDVPQNPGELNFVFTEHICNYISNHGLSYQTINDILGALEGAKLEFYRRVAVPYEETKKLENGDVYE